MVHGDVYGVDWRAEGGGGGWMWLGREKRAGVGRCFEVDTRGGVAGVFDGAFRIFFDDSLRGSLVFFTGCRSRFEGPKYPGKNMNVYLEPLVDDLVRGWEGRGIRTYDASKKEYFDMYVWYHTSLHDLPARALFCGWCTHGKWPCPRRQAVTFFWLNKGGKYSCLMNRQFLERRHAYRSDVKSFKKGRVVRGPKPIPKTGTEIKAELDALQPSPDGNGFLGYGETHQWTHKPCLWKLPYFEFLELPHNIDVMHTEKNISEAIWSTIVDTEKTKDNIKARIDQERNPTKRLHGWDVVMTVPSRNRPPPPNKDDYRRVDPTTRSVEFYQEEGLPGHFTIGLPTIDDMVVDDEQEDAGMDGDNAEDEAEDVCAPEDPSLLEAFKAGIDLDADGPPPAWRWAHYSLAEDPLGRGTAADMVVAKFWKYFKRAEGKENACDDVLHQLARKRVTGMHYEARIQCVRDWHADRFVHMSKEDARDTLMQWHMHNPPQYVGNDDRCFRAMVMWWTCPQYLKKHEEGKAKRAEMRGGSHIQGNIPISLHLQKRKSTGAKPNVFAVLKKMKQRKTPDPETGSVWVNPQSETQCTSYVSKFKQKYGEDANPEAEDFDPEVAVLAGEGLKHGRLWFGDGCVDPARVPSLRQIRRGRKSGQPEVEPRPRASDLAVERLRHARQSHRQGPAGTWGVCEAKRTAAHGTHARHRAQRMRARLSVGRTATYARTAKPPAHGNAVPHGTDFGARQRTERTAEGFAVQNEHAHGNVARAFRANFVRTRTAKPSCV
ncbi:hypothetical protein QYE76_026249 [Lolium multiflorum]|uniref:Uncharacterized protein n=1 Tax=Lolium multiflorum TaxID=4521 RepID=A0AAD8VUY8_LOLMU|nr:hypothetical protein QYE76_026249 [Lolium multiflorum]